MPLDVGSVFVNVGARLQGEGFDKFDRAVAKARGHRDVEVGLRGDLDGRGFDEFDRAVAGARAQAAKPVDLRLTADVDKAAFQEYERELQRARASAARRESFKAHLGADFDDSAFRAYEKALERTARQADRVLQGAAGGAGGGARGLTAHFGGLGGAASRLALIFAPLIPLAVALGGALTALAGSAAAAAAGAGAVAIGFGALIAPLGAVLGAVVQRVGLIGEAYKALGKQQEQAGFDAAAGAEAQHAAARQVVAAEQGMADAQRQVRGAQDDLTEARRRARREVQDLKDAVVDAALAEEGASIALDRALQRLAEVQADPESTALDAREAQHAVRRARAELAGADRDRKRALADAKRGTDTVRDAEDQLAEARRGAARASDAVAEAQRQAARATDQQSASARAAQVALGKLSDTERRLLRAAQDFGDSWRRATAPATEAIFRPVARALDKIGGLLEHFRAGFRGIGQEIGSVVERAASSLAGPEWRRHLDGFVETARRVIGPLSNAFGSVFETLRNIASAARPLVEAFSRTLERWTRGMAEGTEDGDRVRGVIEGLVEHTESWGRFLGSVFRLLKAVFRGGAEDGKGLLDTITEIFNRWADFLNTTEGQRELHEFFREAIFVAKDFARAMADLAGFIFDVSRLFFKVDEAGTNAMVRIQSAVEDLGLAIRNGFREAADNVLGFVTTALGGFSTFADAGSKLPIIGGKFKGVADDINAARDTIDGWREDIREAGREDSWERQMERQQEKVDRLKRRIKTLDEGSEEYRETQDRLWHETGRLNNKLEDGQAAGFKAARGFKRAGDAAASAADASDDAGAAIAASFNALAGEFGIERIRYNARRQRARRGAEGQPDDPGGGGGPTQIRGYAVGGIPNPGGGAADDHLLLDPAGRPVAALSGTEGILNTPQMGITDAALGIAAAVTGGAFPGSLAQLWGMGLRHYAGGGQIVPVPGFPGERAARSTLDEIADTHRRFPTLTLTDAYGKGHRSPGHTVTGTAADWSGPDRAMDAAVRYLVGKGYLVGYDGRFGSQNWPGHGPSTKTPNFHLHVEYGMRGGRVVAAGGAPRIDRPEVEGPGPMGALLRRSVGRLARGAQARLDAVAGTALADARPGGRSVPGEGGVIAGFREAIRRARATPVERLALWEAGIVESGLRNLSYGDRDSVGALQQRPSQGWRGLRNPLRAALEFLQRARALRPWRGSAGQLAQAVQRSAYPERYDQARDRAMRYFKGGGKMGRLQVRAPRQSAVDRTLDRLPTLQTDRIEAYTSLQGQVDQLSDSYNVVERRHSLTAEELVRDDGTLDEGKIAERVAEIDELIRIREAIVARLEQARAVALRIVKSYRTILDRLVRARRSAKRKDRPGYDAQIEAFGPRLQEWVDTESTLSRETLPLARLDVDELRGERAGVLNTEARPEPPRTPTLEDQFTADETGRLPLLRQAEAEAGLTPTTTDDDAAREGLRGFYQGLYDRLKAQGASPELITAAAQALRGYLPPQEAAGAESTADAVARGVREALASFDRGRRDLFSQHGSNFLAPGRAASPLSGIAGLQFFGGGQSGTEGGAVLGAGGRERPNVTQHITFTAPQQQDAHVFTRAARHEAEALL